MGEDAEWEQMKRDELAGWPTEAQYMERQQHIKARGYPEHEPESVWVPEGTRVVVLSRVEDD